MIARFCGSHKKKKKSTTITHTRTFHPFFSSLCVSPNPSGFQKSPRLASGCLHRGNKSLPLRCCRCWLAGYVARPCDKNAARVFLSLRRQSTWLRYARGERASARTTNDQQTGRAAAAVGCCVAGPVARQGRPAGNRCTNDKTAGPPREKAEESGGREREASEEVKKEKERRKKTS